MKEIEAIRKSINAGMQTAFYESMEEAMRLANERVDPSALKPGPEGARAVLNVLADSLLEVTGITSNTEAIKFLARGTVQDAETMIAAMAKFIDVMTGLAEVPETFVTLEGNYKVMLQQGIGAVVEGMKTVGSHNVWLMELFAEREKGASSN